MPDSKKLVIVLIISILGLGLISLVSAQEETPAETTETETTEEATETVELDEDIQPEDLEVSDPTLLPDNPFYFLKNWARGIQSFLTINPVKKIELKLKFANEKIMEAKKLALKKADPEIIKIALANYEGELERLRIRAEKFKEKAEENVELNKFFDKYLTHQMLHHRILQRLEEQVPPEVFERIKETREKHLERFKEVMLRLEDLDKIPERLEQKMEELEGSNFKHFKNLELLDELLEKLPEELQEKIEEKIDRIRERLEQKLEELSPEEQEKFEEYLKQISGDKIRHLRIISKIKKGEISEELSGKIEEMEEEKLQQIEERYLEILPEKAQEQINKAEERIENAEEVLETIDPEEYQGKAAFRLLELAKEHLVKAKEAFDAEKYGRAYGLAVAAYYEALAAERIAKRIEELKESVEKLKEKFEEIYPGVELPSEINKCRLLSPPRCPEGRIVVERTADNCPIAKCVPIVEKPTPTEPVPMVCYQLWDPVCGVDGKTYSNECVATKIAKVEIDYEGICETEESILPLQPTLKRLLPSYRGPAALCPSLWEPVCGGDGKTYANECTALVMGVEIEYEGECR